MPDDDEVAGKGVRRRNAYIALNTLVRIDEQGQSAQEVSEEDLTKLAAFGGWSNAIRGSRDSINRLMATEVQDGTKWVRETLDYDQQQHLRGTILTSFYTPAPVARAVWDGLRKAGFDGGKVLDPSCGDGRFIGHSGDDGTAYRFHGVDLDPIATRIAKTLYPEAHIHNRPFETFNVPDNTFDLAVTNVPFADIGVDDKRYTKQFSRLRIHDYYFVRSMDLVRPGGMIAFLTSYGTLDKEDSRIRAALADEMNLVTAFRLPSGVFEGTDAGADLLVMQKRTATMTPDNQAWIDSIPMEVEHRYTGDARMLPVNQYFQENPTHVLGKLDCATSQFGERLACREHETGEKALDVLSEHLVASMPNGIYSAQREEYVQQVQERREQEAKIYGASEDSTRHLPAGSYVIENNALCQLDAPDRLDEDGNRRAQLANLNATMEKKMRLIVPLRDAALATLDAQKNQCSDEELTGHQYKLRTTYDAFVKKYGPLHHKNNKKTVLAEPFSALLLSLETYDQESKQATTTPIFNERTIGAQTLPDQADTPEDALAMSLNAKGYPNVDYMAALLGEQASRHSITQALGDKIFFDPERQQWATRDEYLSGNIADKLAQAKMGATLDEGLQRNVDALQSVLPEPLTASQISFGLGPTWIPTRIYEQYFATLAGCDWDAENVNANTPVEVEYEASTGQYTIATGNMFAGMSNQNSIQEWSVPKVKFERMCEAAINSRSIKLTKKEDDKTVDDTQATLEVNNILRNMRDQFERWIKDKPNHCDALTEIYNEEVNVWVEQKSDGSHLTFPGLSAAESFRKNQKDAAWRAMQHGNTLLAHMVGAGKTGAMTAMAMECKRIGRANKPMITVPKPVLLDFAAAINRFYPAADVLVIRNEDLKKENRKAFFARVATHNWDSIVVTHDAFARIPMSYAYQRKYIGERLAELENTLYNTENRGTEKNIRRQVKSLQTQLEKLAESEAKDTGTVFFEHLGVDMLLVDEAHYFKNLQVSTNMADTPGVSIQPSKRAADMHMKTTYIMEQNGEERGIVFATGTPVSNTMVELYNMTRYLAPSILEQTGMSNFDAWATQFGRTQTQIERSPDGAGYRMQGRFSKFVNVPELVKAYRQFSDIKMQNELQLPLPDQVEHYEVVEPSTMLKAYMKSLAYRAKNAGHIDERKTDNILSIGTAGRHASLDMRTLSSDMPDKVAGKLDKVVENVYRGYQNTSDDKGVQVVFCDLATPKKGQWSAYQEIKDQLVSKGVPETEIAFAHDANTDEQRARLYEQVRKGDIRVFVGSTGKMGTGVNIQDRIASMHVVDPPHRPADIEQRLGRGIRQGNQYAEVDVYRYATKDTYDEFMFEGLHRKAKFVAQALTTPDQAQRTIEEQPEPQYAEIMALSTGNPLIKEKVDLESSIEEMDVEQNIQTDRKQRRRHEIANRKFVINDNKPRLERIAADLEAREPIPEQFEFVLPDGETKMEGGAKFGNYVLKKAMELNPRKNEACALGTYAGMSYRIRTKMDGIIPVVLLCKEGNYKTEQELSGKDHAISGQVTRMAKALDKAYDRLKESCDRNEKELSELEAETTSPYPRLDEYNKARDRLAEVNRQLTEDAEEANGSMSYPLEEMKAMVLMMAMHDNQGRPVVPPAMLTLAETETARTDLEVSGVSPGFGISNSAVERLLHPEQVQMEENDDALADDYGESAITAGQLFAMQQQDSQSEQNDAHVAAGPNL